MDKILDDFYQYFYDRAEAFQSKIPEPVRLALVFVMIPVYIGVLAQTIFNMFFGAGVVISAVFFAKFLEPVQAAVAAAILYNGAVSVAYPCMTAVINENEDMLARSFYGYAILALAAFSAWLFYPIFV